MSKKCAREECGKTVYPLEELKCLDKVWHKGCFRCTVCGMVLNMKNYKGYDKMPYCEPHYPKTVASVVVDTPEMRRLAENTRLQSQVKYHEEFEKSKGHRIQVADDPELTRHLQNTKIQSQVAYHGEQNKKKLQDEIRPQPEQQNISNGEVSLSANSVPESPSTYAPPLSAAAAAAHHQPTTPYSSKLARQSGTLIYSSEQGGKVPIQQRQVGSIADYDPLNGNWGTVGSSRAAEKIGQLTASHVGAGLNTKGNRPGVKGTGFTVKALYDYTAADKDEVTFVEDDIIVNCQKVDEGWLTGTVQRTLQWGMLPSNYVERVKQPTGLHYLS
uniref:SH3 domain-containing protein n=1 Tax=Wuchereria bancrofti TaxID=6293 RepID=A0AAF5Q322_WUCBA